MGVLWKNLLVLISVQQGSVMILLGRCVGEIVNDLFQPLPLGVGHPNEGEPKHRTADPLYGCCLDYQGPVQAWLIDPEFEGEARRQGGSTFHPTSTR